MAGEGAALHLGPGGLRAASIAARLPKAYIATRAASIANVGLTLPVGGGWMQPHCGASSNTIAGAAPVGAGGTPSCQVRLS